MDIGEAIRNYLSEYGNTREADLINYVKNGLGHSEKGAKKALSKLENNKEVFRVVHGKLRPPAVYFSVKEYVPNEILKEMIRARAKIEAAEYGAYGGIG